MQFKRALNGLTLVEILLALVIASMILVFLVPQQLQYSHEQLVDKTVAQMNQLVLAARNYYQNQRSLVSDNASAWPTTLSQLTANGYLPNAALCSDWPKDPNQQNNANNNGNDCTTLKNNHQEYALFPANVSGSYDITVPGNGNFWGVSIALPSAKVAQEVRDRMPFATTCPPSDLRNTSTPCSTSSNIVTAVVPRPAQWPTSPPSEYAKDGLIQTVGSQVICSDAKSCTTNPKPTATIPIPKTCGNDENGLPLVPQLFVYPLSYQFQDHCTCFRGIETSITRNANTWTVSLGESTSAASPSNFTYVSVGYFTVCQPNSPITGSWNVY
jgi:type II secretory pathway pseudopilin PulG